MSVYLFASVVAVDGYLEAPILWQGSNLRKPDERLAAHFQDCFAIADTADAPPA